MSNRKTTGNISKIKHWFFEKINKIDKPFNRFTTKKRGNSERQFNELRNKINEQKEYFTKEVETLKKHQTEILELNNSINKVKNTTESIGNRADHMEKRISKFKDRNLEMIQVEEKRQLRS